MMKKKIAAALVLASLCCLPVLAYNEGPSVYVAQGPVLTAVQQCSLRVDGRLMDPADGAVLKQKDVVMVPLRKVAENLGYNVNWDPEDQSVRVDAHIASVIVKPGEDWYERIGSVKRVNLNRIYQFGAGPVNVNGTMYVPAQLFTVFFNRVVLSDNLVAITPQYPLP